MSGLTTQATCNIKLKHSDFKHPDSVKPVQIYSKSSRKSTFETERDSIVEVTLTVLFNSTEGEDKRSRAGRSGLSKGTLGLEVSSR